MPDKKAYVTLVTNDDFAIGARALARSIKACGSACPLVVLTNFDGPAIEALSREGCEIKKVERPQLSQAFQEKHQRQALHQAAPFTKGGKPAFHEPLDNFLKLRLWQLCEFERLVFLDADTLMVKNCDELFDIQSLAAAPNLYEDLNDLNRMNSGVFTARPDPALYEQMLKELDRPGAFWRRTDQTFLEFYFPDWHKLSYLYNTLQYVYFQLPGLWYWPKIKIIHYQYEKPWQKDHPKRAMLRPLIDFWHFVSEHGEIPASGPFEHPQRST